MIIGPLENKHFYICERIMGSSYINVLVKVFKYKKLNLARGHTAVFPFYYHPNNVPYTYFLHLQSTLYNVDNR
jgi:hypothetical protein